MADFLTNLWTSIFTPGPTPTLLLATNAAFAALQVLLLGLLIATYSAHFVTLSILTGGLWWAINWFASELRAAQAKEEEAKRIRGARGKEGSGSGSSGGGSGAGLTTVEEHGDGDAGDERGGMDSEDDVETETELEGTAGGQRSGRGGTPSYRPVGTKELPEERFAPSQIPLQTSPGPASVAAPMGATTSLAPLMDGSLKQRRSSGEAGGMSGVSTDSEWEKVEDDR